MASKEAFAKRFGKDLVVGVGAIKTGSTQFTDNYELNTSAGLLCISVSKERSRVFTVYARFDNIEKALWSVRNMDRLNPYSGKYNFHYSTEKELNQAFNYEINHILGV
jgi:hypothetical protein